MLNRRSLVGAAALAVAGSSTWASTAWPSKRVHVIVPYAPGGLADQMARAMMFKAGQVLGQRFKVSNPSGVGGTSGMSKLAKSAADGYTFALSAISPLTLSPHLFDLPYDAQHDFHAVTPVMYSPAYVLATHVFRCQNWTALIQDAKARPNTIRFATAGIGSTGHLMLEHIQAKHGLQLVHMPYQGAGQLIIDAAKGAFEVMAINPVTELHEMIAQERLKVLAVTGPARLPQHPGVPTLAEQGLPEANLTSTFGLFAPAGLSSDIAQRMHDVVQECMQDTTLVDLMQRQNNLPLSLSPQAFREMLRRESQNNAAIIKQAGIKL